jgi:hypothetical protein
VVVVHTQETHLHLDKQVAEQVELHLLVLTELQTQAVAVAVQDAVLVLMQVVQVVREL